MKGNNYAARHDAGAFSAPACLRAESEKQQNMKKEKAGRGACGKMQALFSSDFAR